MFSLQYEIKKKHMITLIVNSGQAVKDRVYLGCQRRDPGGRGLISYTTNENEGKRGR